jgi:hypothetical protein
MKLKLTIDIFSGRPNPTLIVEGNEAKKMLKQIELSAALKTNAKQKEPEHLGYRGIIVDQLDGGQTDFPDHFRITPNRVFAGDQNAAAKGKNIETTVIDSIAKFKGVGNRKEFKALLVSEIENYPSINDAILAAPVMGPILLPRPNPCQCAPLPDLAWWNDGGQRQYNNNCYNYASNYRTDTFAQPGKAAGLQYTSLSACNVAVGQRSAKMGAVSDALIDTPLANNKCPILGHLVALVIAPNIDYHWYRKGQDGRWSHKPGGTQATLLDNAGSVITDPRTANRGIYTQFCTFMQVIHGHTKIK